MSQIEVLDAPRDIVRDCSLFPSIDSSEQSIPLFDLEVDRTAPPDQNVKIEFAVHTAADIETDGTMQLTQFDPVEITLTKGYVAIVDPIDSDLSQHKWYASIGSNVYATRDVKKVTVRLHRIILERMLGRPLRSSEVTDHISGDSLDNRRCNLRVATKSQNAINQKLQKSNKSGCKGVRWHPKHRKWHARIVANNKIIHLGSFDTFEAASAAYIEAAKLYHGEFARLK